MQRYLPLVLVWLALAPAVLAGCDYPQAGYYSFIGRDTAGKAALRLPFAVEELVDDTEMTTGFVLLLPAPMHDGKPQVVEVPVENGTDFTVRSWMCAIAGVDSRAGDLHVTLIHAAERLSLSGAHRPDEFSPVSRLVAALLPANAAKVNPVEFQSNQPQVPGGENVVSWELAAIELKTFEQAIGGALAKAKRLKATAPDQAFLEAALLAEQVSLEQTVAQAEATAGQGSAARTGTPAKRPKLKPGAKQNPPPNLGGRGGSRPR